LIGEAATEEHLAALLSAISGVEEVTRVIDLRTQHIGPEELLVAGKIEFARDLGNAELSDAIDRVESALRGAVPLTMQIYLEPDLFDPTREEAH
jgi:divalent metal cation (Fe/Co/Zn/Cd) transporter